MIRMPVSGRDLSQTRIPYAPMWEAILRYRAVACSYRHTLPVPWAGQLRREAARLDMRPLRAALADGSVLFDFLFPLPTGHEVTFADQIEQLRSESPDEVGHQVSWHYESMDEAPRPELRPFVDRPRQSMDRLASALSSYWEGAFRPHWPPLRAALEADLLHGGRTVAVDGPATIAVGAPSARRPGGRGGAPRADPGPGGAGAAGADGHDRPRRGSGRGRQQRVLPPRPSSARGDGGVASRGPACAVPAVDARSGMLRLWGLDETAAGAESLSEQDRPA